MGNTSRRSFIKKLSAATVTAGVVGSELDAQAKRQVYKGFEDGSLAPGGGPVKGKARSILFLVSDGMNIGTLKLADLYSRYLGKGPSPWLKLYNRKDLQIVRSIQETRSASSIVTDSAAAASAWGSGQRIHNGALNVTPEGKPLRPILQSARDAGIHTSLVSTARITHATPAGFAAQNAERNNEDEIASQYRNESIEILLGGGKRHFEDETRADQADLTKSYQKSGYNTVSTLAHLERIKMAKSVPKVLGTFSNSHIPYVIDRSPNDADLSQLMQQTLGFLEEKRFILQVEAARVDHAGHANDPGTIAREQMEFDQLIPLAINCYEQNPDTLVIITTDHGTGGCQVNGAGPRYNDSTELIQNINKQKASFEVIGQKLAPLRTRNAVIDVLHDDLGYTFTADQIDYFMSVLGAVQNGEEPNPYALANALADPIAEQTAVGWTSHNHTGDPVELAAFGPGSDMIPAYIQNYELHQIMLDALGIKS